MDTYYNTYGEECECGVGTKLKRSGKEQTGPFELCSGRRMLKKSIIDPPTLLFVEASDALEVHQKKSHIKFLDKIEKELFIQGNRFQLVAVIFGNGAHWCAVTVIRGKYLLYDGMFSGQKLRWVPKTFKISSLGKGNYKVSGLWYKYCPDTKDENSKTTKTTNPENEEHTSKADDVEETQVDTSENEFSDNGDEIIPQPPTKKNGLANTSDEDVACLPKSKKRKRGSDSTPKTNRKSAKKRYRMGISITKVEGRGKQPRCAYCLKLMERGLWHAVKRSKSTDVEKNWDAIQHYHFCCLNHFSPEEQEQLLAIVDASDEVSEQAKKSLKKTIETINKRLDRRKRKR